MLEFFGRRLRYIQEVKRDERGFTLIELLVVVIIIGILAAIAIPVFLQQRQKANDAACRSDARNGAAAATAYAADNNGSYASMSVDPAVATSLQAKYNWNLSAASGTPTLAGPGGAAGGPTASGYTLTIPCTGSGNVTFDTNTGKVAGP